MGPIRRSRRSRRSPSAYAGPVKKPAREAGWLALFEGEAVDVLRDECGAGPQHLLEARLAGLKLEAQLLEETLAALTFDAPVV